MLVARLFRRLCTVGWRRHRSERDCVVDYVCVVSGRFSQRLRAS
jgi:hypothetical protein